MCVCFHACILGLDSPVLLLDPYIATQIAEIIVADEGLVYVRVSMYICMYVCMYVFMHVYVYVCPCVCVCVCVCIYAYTHTYIYIHPYRCILWIWFSDLNFPASSTFLPRCPTYRRVCRICLRTHTRTCISNLTSLLWRANSLTGFGALRMHEEAFREKGREKRDTFPKMMEGGDIFWREKRQLPWHREKEELSDRVERHLWGLQVIFLGFHWLEHVSLGLDQPFRDGKGTVLHSETVWAGKSTCQTHAHSLAHDFFLNHTMLHDAMNINRCRGFSASSAGKIISCLSAAKSGGSSFAWWTKIACAWAVWGTGFLSQHSKG